MSPIASLIRDLWLHLKRLRCIVRRTHVDEHRIGEWWRKGHRNVPLFQCHSCAEIYVKSSNLIPAKKE